MSHLLIYSYIERRKLQKITKEELKNNVDILNLSGNHGKKRKKDTSNDSKYCCQTNKTVARYMVSSKVLPNNINNNKNFHFVDLMSGKGSITKFIKCKKVLAIEKNKQKCDESVKVCQQSAQQQNDNTVYKMVGKDLFSEKVLQLLSQENDTCKNDKIDCVVSN